jgi:transposase
MGKFITTDRNQGFLLPPSIEEWLPEDHLARFIADVVDKLDLSDITKHYQRRGSEAHHPSILISLLIYGYATGVYSSRKIEQATYDSLAFRYISGNTHPDHTSLSNFRKNHRSKFESVFVQVLTIAAEMKLLKLGNVAIDGSKVKANASKHKALSYGHILKLEAQLKTEVATLIKKGEEADNKPDPTIDIPAELSRSLLN